MDDSVELPTPSTLSSFRSLPQVELPQRDNGLHSHLALFQNEDHFVVVVVSWDAGPTHDAPPLPSVEAFADLGASEAQRFLADG